MAEVPGFSREQFYNVSQQQHGLGDQGSLRLPRTAPKVLTDQQQGDQAQNGLLQSAYDNAQQPYRDSASMEEPQQRYIPGLNRPTHTNVPQIRPPEPEKAQKDAPKPIPPKLIEEFITGKKNPISALMEYSALCRHKTEFVEVAVDVPTLSAKFAIECRINGQEFPQGVAKTKKEAKTEAAKIAFSTLLGIEEEDIHDEGNVIQDRLGQIIELPPDPTAASRNKPSRLYNYQQLAARPRIQLPEAQAPVEPEVKNAVQQLYEYCQKQHMELAVETGDKPTAEGFVTVVTIGKEVIAQAVAHNKKESKKRACDVAVKLLVSRAQPQQPEEMTYYDHIAQGAIQKIYSLVGQVTNYMGNTEDAAAFVLKRGEGDPGEVVAAATGSQVVLGCSLTKDGRSLIDSNAEVLARKAFLKYIHKELKALHEGRESVFAKVPGSNLARLTEGVTYHLYMSRPSVGDASLYQSDKTMFGPDDLEKIKEGAHFPNYNSDEYGYIRTHPTQGQVKPGLTFDTPPVQDYGRVTEGGCPLLTMSASDKILKWNLLGLQGALFSHFMEPIYLTSITVAQGFDHGHLARAYCCRVDNAINEGLPEGYAMKHPLLGTLSKVKAISTGVKGSKPSLGINWSHGDEKVEILNGCSGRSTEDSPFRTGAAGASRLCKAGFYHRFTQLAKQAGRAELLHFPNYHQAKAAASNYQAAKFHLYMFLRDHGFGTWVKKPPEVDCFVK